MFCVFDGWVEDDFLELEFEKLYDEELEDISVRCYVGLDLLK